MIDERLIELARDPAFWRAVAPKLGVGARTTMLPCVPGGDLVAQAGRQIREDGYLRVPDLALGDELARLRDGIARVTAQGWPAVFVFLYDEPWLLFASMRPLLSALLGEDYHSLAGFWAWSLAPDHAARGWLPHRDRGTPCVRADGMPEIMTLWIAVTDATPENGCIYTLPASRDPNYRTDLALNEVAHWEDVRALPAPAGTVLGWTQQLLHWGGRSSRWAKQPRVSFSMEFQRADFPLVNAPLDAEVPTFEDRAQLIGRQIRNYAHMDPPNAALTLLAEALTR